MNEIKCPKCGNVFSVNEADYASIATQVRNREFQDELSARLAEKEREYADLLSNAMEYELSESVVEVAEADATVFLTFQKDQNRYYMSLSQKGNDVDWKEILENILNSPKNNENLL